MDIEFMQHSDMSMSDLLDAHRTTGSVIKRRVVTMRECAGADAETIKRDHKTIKALRLEVAAYDKLIADRKAGDGDIPKHAADADRLFRRNEELVDENGSLRMALRQREFPEGYDVHVVETYKLRADAIKLARENDDRHIAQRDEAREMHDENCRRVEELRELVTQLRSELTYEDDTRKQAKLARSDWNSVCHKLGLTHDASLHHVTQEIEHRLAHYNRIMELDATVSAYRVDLSVANEANERRDKRIKELTDGEPYRRGWNESIEKVREEIRAQCTACSGTGVYLGSSDDCTICGPPRGAAALLRKL